jgi:hypothetical protein
MPDPLVVSLQLFGKALENHSVHASYSQGRPQTFQPEAPMSYQNQIFLAVLSTCINMAIQRAELCLI